jgi:hypothetical protein
MARLHKQIMHLDWEIERQKKQLAEDYGDLKDQLGATPNLFKGFLWGFAFGFLVIAPKIKHLTTAEKKSLKSRRSKTRGKEASKEGPVQKFLLASLPGIIKLL